MKKIRVGLVGPAGRMGKEVIRILDDNAEMELFYPLPRNEKIDPKKAAKVDVWIDFSTPGAFAEIMKIAMKNRTPVVSGTTGFSSKEKALLKKIGKEIPLLWSSNMSLGVAVLNEALRSLAAISQFDFQVEEFHHIRKKDRPSGTALTIQENLVKIIGKKLPPPLSIRGGGIFGIHKIFAMSEEEVLTFEHSALNRTVFARGAVLCARWLIGKKPGNYEIRDVLFGKN